MRWLLLSCALTAAACGEKVERPCEEGDLPYCEGNVAWNCVGGELHTGTVPFEWSKTECPTTFHPETTECAVIGPTAPGPSATCVISDERGSVCPLEDYAAVCDGTKKQLCIDGYLMQDQRDCAETGEVCRLSDPAREGSADCLPE